MHDRRTFVKTGLGAVALAGPARLLGEAGAYDPVAALRAIEARAGGRLGVCLIDRASGHQFGWRANERFTHCSSFKLSLAALALAGGPSRIFAVSRILHWRESDLLGHSPVTRAHLASGLTVRELAHAALVESDNTAANVLLHAFGGPGAMTQYWRSLGDTVSRLDRFEPDLNVTPPGTALDTTTPAAMAHTVQTLLYGHAFGPTLRDWMAEVTTGSQRLRASFPADWICGDKTGTGPGTYVDLAYGGPPGRAPLIVTAYFEPSLKKPLAHSTASAVLAQVGAVAVQLSKVRA